MAHISESWEIEHGDIIAPNGELIATVHYWSEMSPGKYHENLHLIKAAPDLARVVSLFLETDPDRLVDVDLRKMAKNALDRTRGQSQSS